MRHSRGADHSRALELDVLRTHPLEQAGPVAEQDGHQMDPQLVNQSGSDELSDDVRATQHDHVPVTRGRLGPLKGRLNAWIKRLVVSNSDAWTANTAATAPGTRLCACLATMGASSLPWRRTTVP